MKTTGKKNRSTMEPGDKNNEKDTKSKNIFNCHIFVL